MSDQNEKPMDLTALEADQLIAQLVDAYGSSPQQTMDVLFNYEWFMYLLQRWENLTIYLLNPNAVPISPPQIIHVKYGWSIHDYGDKLVISRGSEWPKGHITHGGLLSSVQTLVNVLLAKNQGLRNIEVDAVGFAAAVRIAWVVFSQFNINVRNFQPSPADFQLRDRVYAIQNATKPGMPGLQI